MYQLNFEGMALRAKWNDIYDEEVKICGKDEASEAATWHITCLDDLIGYYICIYGNVLMDMLHGNDFDYDYDEEIGEYHVFPWDKGHKYTKREIVECAEKYFDQYPIVYYAEKSHASGKWYVLHATINVGNIYANEWAAERDYLFFGTEEACRKYWENEGIKFE